MTSKFAYKSLCFLLDVVSADFEVWKVDHDKFIGEVSCALTSFSIYPLDINCDRKLSHT